MRGLKLLLLAAALLVAPGVGAEVPVTLKGSPASMKRQSNVAKSAGYAYVEVSKDMQTLVATGELVPVVGNVHFRFKNEGATGVARPELRLFIERFAAQYHEATGEQLVVTSLTRSMEGQPKNAHTLSVHPAGIAVDLRISQQKKSRQWLEETLLELERAGLLDVTREKYPPHYHVALFPEAYLAHVERLIGPEALAVALYGEVEAEEPAAEAVEVTETSTVTTESRTLPSGWWKWMLAAPLVALTGRLLRLRRRKAEEVDVFV